MKQGYYKPEFHDSFSGLKGLRRLGANYVWLLYSVFFFIDPLLRRDATFWLESAAAYLVFLPLYIWYVETKRPQTRLPLVIAICLMGIATMPWNAGGNFFFIFAAALVPFAVRRMRSALIFMAIEVGTIAAEWFVDADQSNQLRDWRGFPCRGWISQPVCR